MKRIIFKIVMLLLIFYSCKKEEDDFKNQQNIDFSEAKCWYEENKPNLLSLKSAQTSKSKINGKPDWNFGKKINHKNYKTVEIPLKTQGMFGFANDESLHKYEQTNDLRYKSSITYLVIKTEKKSNETIGFLMTIIPDASYREENDFKVFKTTYKKWQKDFSGMVLYHTLEGNFANGWILSCGTVTKSVSEKNESNIDINLKSMSGYDCVDYYSHYWYEICVDYYSQNYWSDTEYYIVYSGSSCVSSYTVSYAYTVCTYDGEGEPWEEEEINPNPNPNPIEPGDYIPPEEPEKPYEPKDPCQLVNKANTGLTDLQKERLNEFKDRTSDKVEHASMFFNDRDPIHKSGTSENPCPSFSTYPHNELSLFAHMHPEYDPKTGVKLSPIPSPEDIVGLHTLVTKSKLADDFLYMAVAKNVTYMISIEDLNKFKNKKIHTFQLHEIYNFAKKLHWNKYDTNSDEGLQLLYEQIFTEVFEDYGIKLHKSSNDAFDWTENDNWKTLNNDSTNKEINLTPCEN